MLSYLHEFHAGNHADILKHFTVCSVLNSLNKKDKPYTFFETHAGSGLYDLTDEKSTKTGEAKKGIVKILETNWEDEITEQDFPNFYQYLSTVQKYVCNNKYPGSPELERIFMRSSDFLVLSELHPLEIEKLKKNIRQKDKNPQIQIHNRNGWEMIKALTPPKTKRGAVLIDPSYEETQDYFDAADTIVRINQKWSNGIIMLWYPLLSHREAEIFQMKETITENVKKINQNIEIADLQLCVQKKDAHKEVSLNELEKDEDKKNPPRLYGSGMLIINTPWKLTEEAEKVISFCEKNLKSW